MSDRKRRVGFSPATTVRPRRLLLLLLLLRATAGRALCGFCVECEHSRAESMVSLFALSAEHSSIPPTKQATHR